MAVVDERSWMRLVEVAKIFLRDRGFDILGSFRVGKSNDSGIVASLPSGEVVAAAVLDAGKMTSIPLNGLGTSKAAKERAARFAKVARGEVARALGWTLPTDVKPTDFRYDALWLEGSTAFRSPAISHLVNIKV